MLTVPRCRTLACLFPLLVSGQKRGQASDVMFLLYQDFVSDIPGLPMKLLFRAYISMFLNTLETSFLLLIFLCATIIIEINFG